MQRLKLSLKDWIFRGHASDSYRKLHKRTPARFCQQLVNCGNLSMIVFSPVKENCNLAVEEH